MGILSLLSSLAHEAKQSPLSILDMQALKWHVTSPTPLAIPGLCAVGCSCARHMRKIPVNSTMHAMMRDMHHVGGIPVLCAIGYSCARLTGPCRLPSGSI